MILGCQAVIRTSSSCSEVQLRSPGFPYRLARKREPLWGSCKMTRPICFKVGPRWIAVPGELRGYEEAHRRYGKLPWKTLFEPTIKFLDPGIRIPEGQELMVVTLSSRKLFYNKQGAALGGGDLLRWPALVETLRAVAEKGANEFYRGTTAEKLVQDIAKEGSTLSLRDLRDYRVEVMSPVNISLGEYTVYSAPRPAAGPILLFILNVLKGFNFTKESMSTPSQNAETYHYIAETLKFANGQRVKLDDPLFSRTGEGVLSELISDSFASQVRQRIDERGDHPASHYDAVQVGKTSFGTSHVSVLAEDGSAVSATSTINYPFGSMVYSPQTGIILNNELSDFCMKKSSDRISDCIGCSPSHSLVPPPIGEMPPSSMTPSILISRDGQSKLVVGGSGGQLIIPTASGLGGLIELSWSASVAIYLFTYLFIAFITHPFLQGAEGGIYGSPPTPAILSSQQPSEVGGAERGSYCPKVTLVSFMAESGFETWSLPGAGATL
uniref:Gamma-glutamyltransferase 5 n=1 Tax=Podarcis muralis TaxID=64176 RepID=A0A670JXD2_PODMU